MRDQDQQTEHRRLDVLHRLHLLNSPPPPVLQEMCHQVRDRFGTPLALLTLIDRDRQVIKAGVGTELKETPRSAAFCDSTIHGDGVVVSPDTTRDPRFAGNPLVTGAPFVRFYAGAPLIYMPDIRLGSLCLLDLRPRKFGPDDMADLAAMAEEVMLLIIEHELAQVTERPWRRSG